MELVVEVDEVRVPGETERSDPLLGIDVLARLDRHQVVLQVAENAVLVAPMVDEDVIAKITPAGSRRMAEVPAGLDGPDPARRIRLYTASERQPRSADRRCWSLLVGRLDS